MESSQRSDTVRPLGPEPTKLTEREILHMEQLARVLYGMYVRQTAAKEPEPSLDNVLGSPRVFAPASTAIN